ncbi:hypothetical protein VNO78_23057 [Psophocarpus tetragonolobus]|uniref:Uncharacterized protein n=1 Tax=Psophocarpus tetragonolobus TaxID=3891 RepID=A0AAN9XDL3_PSOTE
MASTWAISMGVPLTYGRQKRVVPSSEAFSKAMVASKANGRFNVRASMKEKVVTGLTAAALTASMMVPEVAEAAVTPSLNNFLLSIAAGGVVAVAIVGAVIDVQYPCGWNSAATAYVPWTVIGIISSSIIASIEGAAEGL